MFNVFRWFRQVPEIKQSGHNVGAVQQSMGDEWHNLHPQIQRRFSENPNKSGHIFYRGCMDTVECSRSGRVFAFFTRLIANPLTPYQGKNVKMDVILYKKKGVAGVYWRRTYFFRNQDPHTITSVKRLDRFGNITENVGGGFGMVLKLSAPRGNLHFSSTQFYWEYKRFRIHLPDILSPGKTVVIHENISDDSFRFTIKIDHKYLGQTFYQTGIFHETSDVNPPV